MDPTDPNAALLFRKAQLEAQLAGIEGAPQPGMPPAMPGAQAQFSGYSQQPAPRYSPQQLQRLALLLQSR